MPRSATANVDVSTGVLVGASGPRKKRYYLNEFEKLISNVAGVVTAGSFSQTTGDTNLESDQDFVLSGTNSAVGNVTHSTTTGGLVLTTTDASANQCVIFPNVSAAVNTGFSDILWDTGAEAACEWGFKTHATQIDNQILFAGFKVSGLAAEYSTATGTDADQVYVDYIAGSNGNKFLVRYSYAGNDVTIDSGLEMVANTSYWIKIAFDADKYANVTIGTALDPGNAPYVKTKHAISSSGAAGGTAVTPLKPTFGIQQSCAAQAAVTIDYVACGRNR